MTDLEKIIEEGKKLYAQENEADFESVAKMTEEIQAAM